MLPTPSCPAPPTHPARLQWVPLAGDEHLVVALHAAYNLQGRAGQRKEGQGRRLLKAAKSRGSWGQLGATKSKQLQLSFQAAACVSLKAATHPPPHPPVPTCPPMHKPSSPNLPTHLCCLPVPHKQLALPIPAHQEAAVPAEGRLAGVACTRNGSCRG